MFLLTENVLHAEITEPFVSKGAMGKMAAVIPLFKVWQLWSTEEDPVWRRKRTFSGPQ